LAASVQLDVMTTWYDTASTAVQILHYTYCNCSVKSHTRTHTPDTC